MVRIIVWGESCRRGGASRRSLPGAAAVVRVHILGKIRGRDPSGCSVSAVTLHPHASFEERPRRHSHVQRMPCVAARAARSGWLVALCARELAKPTLCRTGGMWERDVLPD